MSVFIKDMKKPKSCDECPIALWSLPKDCNFAVEMCPIVEIKEPHGRLVDESEIHTGIRMEKNTEHRYFIDKVNAPTVIESEVE